MIRFRFRLGPLVCGAGGTVTMVMLVLVVLCCCGGWALGHLLYTP